MKFNIFDKFKLNIFSKKWGLLFFVLIFAVIFFLPAPVQAGWAERVIGGLLSTIISGVGLILIAAVRALTMIVQYSYFLDSGAVSYGWIVVRDFCNMFFVVVLLIIAFGTILNIEKYNYKKWLPKLILMAILINFSKTICGLLIDLAQVVMLTFVASFADISSATLLNVLGIDNILNFKKEGELTFWTAIGAYLLALAYVIISLIVVVTMMVMLCIRIVMLWIYIVLSPLAYLMQAFPGGQQYASQWWSEFIKNLIVGPVLAFFLWLSFAGLQADNLRDSEDSNYAKQVEGNTDSVTKEQSKVIGEDVTKNVDSSTLPTKTGSPDALIKFVIAIGMLVGGLKISQQIGGAAGSMAGKGMNYVNKAGSIGLKGAAAITGVRAAQGIYKSYAGARKSKREDGYKDKMMKVAGGIGKAKKAVGGGVIKLAQHGKRKVGLNNFGNEADKKQAEIEKERQDFDIANVNYNSKEGKVGDYEYNKKTKNWQDSAKNVVDKKIVENSLKSQKKATDTKVDEVKDLRKKQRNKDAWVGAGAMVGLGALALVTGGGAAGLFLAGAGGAAAYGGYTKTKKAGKIDEDISSNYRVSQIKKQEEGMKDEDNSTILATMDDASSSALRRAAAAMEAMRRGLLTSEQARVRREMMKKELGGADKNNNFKDKKLGSYVEATLQKHNLSASRDFQDLESTDPRKKETAEANIKDRVVSGDLHLKDMDKGGAEHAGRSVVEAMPLKVYKKEMEDIKDPTKKREWEDVLAASIENYDPAKATEDIDKVNFDAKRIESMQKLNHITNLNVATESISDDAEKLRYKQAIVAPMTAKEIQEIFDGNNVKQQELIQELYRDIVVDPGKTKLETLFSTAYDSLISASPAMVNLVNKIEKIK